MQCRGMELLSRCSATTLVLATARNAISLAAMVAVLAVPAGCAERVPDQPATWEELSSVSADGISRVVLGLAPKPRLPQYQFEITQLFAARLFVESLQASKEPCSQATTSYDVPSVLQIEARDGDTLDLPLEVDPGRPQAVKWVGEPARVPSADFNELISMVVGIRGFQSRPPMRSDRELATPFTDDEVRYFVKAKRYDMALAIYTEVRRLYAAKPAPLSDLDRGQWAHWVDEQRLLFQDMQRYVDAAECCEEQTRLYTGATTVSIMNDTKVNEEWRVKYRMFQLAGRLYVRAGECRKALAAFERGQTLLAEPAVKSMSPREVAEVKVACLYRCKLGAADALRGEGRYREALAVYQWLQREWGDGSLLRRQVLQSMPAEVSANFRRKLDEVLRDTIPDGIRACEAGLRGTAAR